MVAQNRMKKQADSKRRELVFEVGDEVLLKLHPYRQRSLARKKCAILAPRYYGLCKVIERVGEVAYKLELPPEAAIRNVFHISQLKKMVGQRSQSSRSPTCSDRNLNCKLCLKISWECAGTRNWQ